MTPPDIRSLEHLLEALEQGLQPRYLFFWGHRPAADGRPNKSCLSQWFEAAFEVQGQRYPSAEHYMMARKAELFGDRATLAAILKAGTPGKAKALGRIVRGFDGTRWNAHREAIVVEANRHKFGQHPALGDYLLSTGQRILVEASPVDRIWGIGLAQKAPEASDPKRWKGLNLLGFALMQVRAALAR